MNTYKRIKQNRIKNIDSSDKIFDEIISSGQRSINKEEEEEDIENVVDNIQTELSQSTDANERLKPNHSIDNEEHDSQNTTKKRRSRKNTDFIDDLNKRRAHLSKRRVRG